MIGVPFVAKIHFSMESHLSRYSVANKSVLQSLTQKHINGQLQDLWSAGPRICKFHSHLQCSLAVTQTI